MVVQRSPRRGFTLVELLVVIGIIGVLISILLPTLSKARQAANLIACQSNLRNMYAATVMYQNTYKGYLPQHKLWYFGLNHNHPWDHPPVWFNSLPTRLGMKPMASAATYYYFTAPYPNSIFKCPSAAQINDQPNTYAMNDCLMQWMYRTYKGMQDEDLGIKANFFRNKTMDGPPGRTWNLNNVPYMMDGMMGNDGFNVVRYVDYRSYTNCDSLPFGGAPTNDAWLRRLSSNPHKNGYNCLFIDGHIEWLPPKDPLVIQANDPAASRAVKIVPQNSASEDWVW